MLVCLNQMMEYYVSNSELGVEYNHYETFLICTHTTGFNLLSYDNTVKQLNWLLH
jgi:hypothetical protein